MPETYRSLASKNSAVSWRISWAVIHEMGQAETRPNPGSRAKLRAQKRYCLQCNRKLSYSERWNQTSAGKGGGALRLCVCSVTLTLLPVSPSGQTRHMEKWPGAPGGASLSQLLSEAACPAREPHHDCCWQARDAEVSPLKLVREEGISSVVLTHTLVMAYTVQSLARQWKLMHVLIEHLLPLL